MNESVTGCACAGLLCLIALTVVLTPLAAAAAQKTDVITLRNGDRITGEIKEVTQGRLRLSTDAMDTVSIRWIDIAAVDSDKTLEVEVQSGERIYGSLQPGEQPGDVVVVGAGEPVPVPRERIAAVWPIGQSFWKKLDGNVSLGVNFTQASDQVESDVTVNSMYTTRNNRVTVDISSTVKAVQGTTTTNRHQLQADWQRETRWPNWFTIVLGGLQHNSELNLDYRGSIGGGFGRYLRNTSRYRWATYAAGMLSQEQYTGDAGRQNFDLLGGTTLEVYIYGEHDLTFNTGLEVSPSLTDAGRVRVVFNSSLAYELVHNFTIGLQLFEQYDSQPPQEDALKNDLGINTTLGYKW
jgi:hypothetical protein